MTSTSRMQRGWMRGLVCSLLACAVGACTDGGDSAPTAPTGEPSDSGTDTDATATGSTTGSTGVDTLDSAGGTGSTGSMMELSIDCADPPAGAVGADYSHTPEVAGAQGAVSWQVEGLPPGMTFDPLSGALGGAPQEDGSFEVSFVASTVTQMNEQTCTIEVGPGLSFDLSGLDGPCIEPGDDLLALASGGDGSPIACSTPGGTGNGVLPEGVSVDPRTCTIEGSSDEMYGTWAWITRVEQAGAAVFVPYCYTIADQAPGAYAISGLHSGGTKDALQPAVRTFAPEQPLSFGGEPDPRFEVLGPCGPGSCYYGYAYFVSPSPFGNCGENSCFGMGPTALLSDVDGDPIGFEHHLWALGEAPSEAWHDRAFVLSWRLHYCISSSASDCDGATNIQQNGDGQLRFSVIMQPQ